MINVLHVPGNIEIIGHANSSEVSQAETSLKPPITLDALLAHNDWSPVDVVHLHTVEFATEEQLRKLMLVRELGKRLVFTVHELSPNIESDQDAFTRKNKIVGALADSVITLSQAAALEAEQKFEIPSDKISVIPHGQPFARPAIDSIGTENESIGIAAYGAMRTYRSYTGLLKAWQTLEPTSRPPLRMLLRSVSAFDLSHYQDDIKTLESSAENEADFSLQIHNKFLEQDELVSWLKQSRVLALPYTDITHSGQLELGLDLGMGVISPDLATLRSQAAPHPRSASLIRFVDRAMILCPANYAEQLIWHPADSASSQKSENEVRKFREGELEAIKAGHRRAYGLE